MRRRGTQRRIAAALGAALLALACGSVAMRPRGDWRTARSHHFELASGLDEQRTREIAAELERFRALALDFAQLEDRPSGPTQVVLFPHARNFAAVRPRRDLSGLFVSSPHRSSLAIDASEREEGLRIARHEVVHWLQSANSEAPLPAWIREGMADLLSTARFSRGGVEIGAPPGGRLEIARAAPLPLARVLAANDVMQWKHRALAGFYAQSWALTHYLRVGGGASCERSSAARSEAESAEPEAACAGDSSDASSAAQRALADFSQRVAAGEAADSACLAAFGRDVDTLERELLAYLEQPELPRVRIPHAASEAPALAFAPLSDAARDALLGDLALSIGEQRWKRAQHWLEAALAREPEHALAQASLASLAAQRGDANAVALLSAATAPAQADADAAWRIGDAWLALTARPASEDALREHFARAETSFARATALDPGHAGARLGRARVALARGEIAAALRELEAARSAAPLASGVDAELARAQQLSGNSAAARASLSRVLGAPHQERSADLGALARLARDAGFTPGAATEMRHLAARLDVTLPAAGAEARSDLAWFELRGKAGLWEAPLHDVVLALDVSNTTLEASGADVDGDGKVGRARKMEHLLWMRDDPRRASSDRGDSVVRAELAAARRLAAELDERTTRLGLVLFTATARLAAPLGGREEILRALDMHRVHYDSTGTSFEAPLRTAFEELIERREPGRRAQRTILFLSDGQDPTAPNSFEARTQALEIAQQIAEFGVRVHAFAVGERATDEGDTLREIAEITGGEYFAVADLSDISFLERARLTGLDAVAVRNKRSGEVARAVRTFPDGSFDALVGLEPGANEIEIEARVAGRAALRETRRIVYEPAHASDVTREARAAELLRKLRERSEAIALRAQLEAERAAREQQRALTIETEDVSAGPPPAD